MSFLALAAAAVCAGLPRPVFQHSWDTLPVFWFSANESALEGPSGQALMASKFPIAILAYTHVYLLHAVYSQTLFTC